MEYYIDPVEFILQKQGGEALVVRNLLRLLDEGATIPFIARYRKEQTGSMDEVRIGEIQVAYVQFQELEKRKASVLEAIRGQGRLTAELERQIRTCMESRVLEDLYLPYTPKKQTRAARAKAKGLEPLAAILLSQGNGDVGAKAGRFVRGEIRDEEEALQGARDIMAEWVCESEVARNCVRRQTERGAFVYAKVVKGKENEGVKYADYFLLP